MYGEPCHSEPRLDPTLCLLLPELFTPMDLMHAPARDSPDLF